MEKQILIRFGDLMLKGKNIKYFLNKVNNHIKKKLTKYNCKIDFRHDRVFIEYKIEDEENIISDLKKIQGLHSFSVIYKSTNKIEDIIKTGIEIINTEIKQPTTIKIQTKRTDKRYPLTSLEITKTIAGEILKQAQVKLTVDVHNPLETLHVEVHPSFTFLYLKTHKGLGGFPYATGGKALLMLSGGIDSPVAGYLALKRGLDVELMHFESTPLTPIESAQKALDLALKLSDYTSDEKIKLHFVPFMDIHKNILDFVYEPYTITIMRRMMYRIASNFSEKNHILALINGEAVGQVASQTLESLLVLDEVSNLPVLRPLLTYDKQDIINIAKEIDTYDISIKPFNDCCSIYVPKAPTTKPRLDKAKRYEQSFPFENLIEETINKIITVTVNKDSNIDLAKNGFTVTESLGA